MRKEILRMEHIVSRYGSKRVLNDARLNLFEDEIIGIIGVNYSGKSTLVGIAAGLNAYEDGKVYLNEEEIRLTSIQEAHRAGIFYIQHKSSLIADFSILENFYLTVSDRGLINKKKIRHNCQEILELLQIETGIHQKISNLSFKNRILVEIGKALAYEAKIIILDNVMNGLSAEALNEFQQVFAILTRVHISLILVDNGIRHLKPYCSRLFVMRDGRTAAVLKESEIEENLVISLMIGYRLEEKPEGGEEKELRRISRDDVSYGDQKGYERVLLEFKGIHGDGVLHNLNLKVYQGEITGILNVNKNSGHTMEALLLGNVEVLRGKMLFEERVVRFSSPKDAVQTGIVVIPEYDSIIPDLTIEENIKVSALELNSGFAGSINEAELKYIAGELISEYIKKEKHVYITDSFVPKNRLIRRKILLCRALATNPKLIVFVNAAQTIDVIAKERFYEDILSLKIKGISVMVISSDLKDLTILCDRIHVVNKGRCEYSMDIAQGSSEKLFHTYGRYLREI